MKIGIASVDTTPPVGTYLGGFARMRDSVGVRDALEVTAVWLEAGLPLVVLCADLVFIHGSLAAQVRERARRQFGADLEVLVACSHSHATPYGTHGAPAARFQNYANRWVDSALEAIARAKAEAVEGAIRWRTGTHAIGINRRLPGADGRVDFGWNEGGPTDSELGIVELVDTRGAPIGHVITAAVHPIVLPPWSRLASADWVGEMRREVRSATGRPCGFIQGACADVNPRHEWVPRRFRSKDVRGPHAARSNDDACRVLGTAVADATLSLLGDPNFEPVPDGPVAIRRSTSLMALTPREDEGGHSIPYWRALAGKGVPKWLADGLLARAFPWKTPVSESVAIELPLEIACARLGGLAICSHGSEPFAETGLAIKEDSPAPFTVFAGYTDGMIGYVPTDRAIPRGGYEVDTVPALYRLPGTFATGSEPRAVRETLALARALWPATP